MGVHPAEIKDQTKNKDKTCAELLRMTKTIKVPVQLEVEKALEGTEHKILWLPPYHCMYNPIELVSIKGTFLWQDDWNQPIYLNV